MSELKEIKNKRIVLVGGVGFIGHNLALRLKALGAEVSVVDGLLVNNLLSLYCYNNMQQERELYLRIIEERLSLLRENDIPLFVEDARDYHRLTLVLNSLNPQVIIHLVI